MSRGRFHGVWVVPMRWVFLGLALASAAVISRMGPRGAVSDRPPLMLLSDMDDQPRYNAQGAGPFFPDGRAMRMPPAGTVPFGGADYDSDAGSPRQNPDFLREDDGYYRGKQGQAWLPQNPLNLDESLLRRGQERYNIYCALCHGATGSGKGIMTQYGMVGVASITDELHRLMSDGEYFNVISNGKGRMMGYAPQIKVRDRWAIVAYVPRVDAKSGGEPLGRSRLEAWGDESMISARPPHDPVSLSSSKGYALVGTFLVLAVATGLAVVAGTISGDRWFFEPRRLAFSYLTGLMFVTSVSVGALAWLMLHHLTGAVWSVVIRRLLENLTAPLRLIVILFIPVALNLVKLYPWADPSRLAADPGLARKAVWLNPTLFSLRAAAYIAAWALISALLTRSSARQDLTGDSGENRRMHATSAWGMITLALTTSLAAFDWLMSLDPHWSSTIFGVYFWAGSLVSSLAALVLTVLVLRGAELLRETITVEHLHDLGKLLFGFVIFWAYIAFCQYFLIWYANFPEETHWYVTRRTGIWNTLSWSLVFGHFVVPFVLLLFRAVKRDPFWLGFIAIWILAFHYIDLYWLIMPALGFEAAGPSWLDASLALTLAFTCGAIVARACQVRPLIPVGDSRMAESIAFRNS